MLRGLTFKTAKQAASPPEVCQIFLLQVNGGKTGEDSKALLCGMSVAVDFQAQFAFPMSLDSSQPSQAGGGR